MLATYEALARWPFIILLKSLVVLAESREPAAWEPPLLGCEDAPGLSQHNMPMDSETAQSFCRGQVP